MSEAEKVGLTTRLEELELRLKLLEARVRTAAQPKAKQGKAGAKATKPPANAGAHRCPGCTLELPKGRRGESCVWCGFRFDGVALLESSRRTASER